MALAPKRSSSYYRDLEDLNFQLERIIVSLNEKSPYFDHTSIFADYIKRFGELDKNYPISQRSLLERPKKIEDGEQRAIGTKVTLAIDSAKEEKVEEKDKANESREQEIDENNKDTANDSQDNQGEDPDYTESDSSDWGES